MAEKQLSPEQLITMLAATPSRIATLTAALAPERMQEHPAADEWSINDILAHLRACADVWGDCMHTIATQDSPTIRAINPVTWMSRTDYPHQAFHESLNAFTTQRTDLLAMLAEFDWEMWSRSAKVTGAGKPLQYTILNYAQRLAVHERQHLKHIERLIKTFQANP